MRNAAAAIVSGIATRSGNAGQHARVGGVARRSINRRTTMTLNTKQTELISEAKVLLHEAHVQLDHSQDVYPTEKVTKAMDLIQRATTKLSKVASMGEETT
jgi:hypothetical protein